MSGHPTVSSALATAQAEIAALSETPTLDAQLLLADSLERDREWLLAHPEAHLEPSQLSAYLERVARIEAGEALPYVLGWWDFYGRRFRLTPEVLIPRPETEILVEEALGYLDAHPSVRRVVDVGTGSGCILISLAAERPDVPAFGCDTSFQALKVAEANARTHAPGAVSSLVQSDLLTALRGPFDLICANLPYLSTDEVAILEVGQREPSAALHGGPEGLGPIRRLIRQLPGSLNPGGRALLEIGAFQAEALVTEVGEVLPAARIAVQPDLAGLDRILVIDR